MSRFSNTPMINNADFVESPGFNGAEALRPAASWRAAPVLPTSSPVARQSALILMSALITFANGLANLFSVISTSYHARPPVWLETFPLEFFRFPRSFTLLVGLALTVSALNIYKRKKRAFQIVLGLAMFSVLLHLLRGHHQEQAAFGI